MVEERGDGCDPAAAGAARRRPYIGILFECCGVYVRVYRRPEQRAYFARCPGCLRMARVRVDRRGTKTRIFRAY